MDYTYSGSGDRVLVRKASDDLVAEGTIRERHQFRVDEREEPPPVGSGNDLYPTPVDYMLAGLAACQLSVLCQCLAKARVDTFEIEVSANDEREYAEDHPEEMPEHTAGRLTSIDVELELSVPREYEDRARRCLEVYDQGCIVGQSIRAGIEYAPDVTLSVTD